MPATLFISRKSEKDIKIRRLWIVVDEEEVADLAYSRTLQVTLSAGKHTLKITNNLFSESLEIEIEEGETKSFSVANLPNGWAPMLLVVVGIFPYGVELKEAPVRTGERVNIQVDLTKKRSSEQAAAESSA